MNGESPKYDAGKRSKAGTTASLRAVAVGYLLYLGYTLLRDVLDGTTTLPLWLSVSAAVVFIGVAVAFGFYTWRRYRCDVASALLQDETVPDVEERL